MSKNWNSKSVSLIQSKNDTVQALREPHKNVSKNKKNPLLFKIVGDKVDVPKFLLDVTLKV